MKSYLEMIDGMSSENHEYRKAVMERYSMSAVEVDVMLFLANNPSFDTASDIVRARKISKSHVSLAVKGLMQKGYLAGVPDETDHKKIRLIPQKAAEEMILYGQKLQQQFAESLFEDFSEEEREIYIKLSKRMLENVCRKQKERKGKEK